MRHMLCGAKYSSTKVLFVLFSWWHVSCFIAHLEDQRNRFTQLCPIEIS
jgi:hypothetical protein